LALGNGNGNGIQVSKLVQIIEPDVSKGKKDSSKLHRLFVVIGHDGSFEKLEIKHKMTLERLKAIVPNKSNYTNSNTLEKRTSRALANPRNLPKNGTNNPST
jgi:hypothetical protein